MLHVHTKFRQNWSTGSGERFLKGFYHIWMLRPSWSCDQHHFDKFSFLCTQKLTHKIWLKMAQWFLRKASFNFQMTLILNTYMYIPS